MINVTIRYDNNERQIDFPCSGHVLDAKLGELGVRDMTEAKMFVTQVNDFKFFSFLEDDFVDLDELNLLANRLQYLDSKELEKFECVADEFNIRNSRDLINLTANLHRFTLIQDLSSPEQIGRTHYFTRLISIDDETNIPTDFAKIGRELVNSGTGRFTEHGMLFVKGDETPIKSIRYIKTGDEIPEIGTENRTEDGFSSGKKDKTNGTEGMFGGKKTEDSTSGTEGMFGGKKDYSDKTESGFESRINDDEKTEGMFGKKIVTSKKKKSIWKNWITYAAGGVVVVGLCVGGFFLFNNPAVPASYSVASVAELKEPVEVKISNEAIPQSDFDTIVKRLNAFGADFYIDQNTGVLALNKSDLGSTNQEILATLHMLTGEGKIKLDSPAGSENALSIDDIEKAVYSDNKDNNCTYVNIKLNDKGAEKIAKIDEEMQSAGQDHLMYLYVDDNLRANNGVFEVITLISFKVLKSSFESSFWEAIPDNIVMSLSIVSSLVTMK